MTPRQKQIRFRNNVKEFAIDFLASVALMALISALLYAGITM